MKYDKLEKELYKANVDVTSLESILAKDETILWRGKPKKRAYIYGPIVENLPSFILGLIVVIAFFTIVYINFGSESFWVTLIFTSIFWIIGLFKGIGKIIADLYRYKNIDYALTDRRIIIRSGLIGVDYKSINYKEIKEIKLNVGLIDRLFKVGDIYIYTGDEYKPAKSKKIVNQKVFFDVQNCYEVFKQIQKIVLDIQTDMTFPNKLRPEENPGYSTEKEQE